MLEEERGDQKGVLGQGPSFGLVNIFGGLFSCVLSCVISLVFPLVFSCVLRYAGHSVGGGWVI